MLVGIRLDLGARSLCSQPIGRSHFVDFHFKGLLAVLSGLVFCRDLLLRVHVGWAQDSREIFEPADDLHRLCLQPNIVENTSIRDASFVIFAGDCLGWTRSILMRAASVLLL